MSQLLQLHHVTKNIKRVAVDDVTLSLPAGKIIGLLDQTEVERQHY